MRRLFLLFVVLVATTALWAHDFEVNGIYYNYLDETSVEVTYKGSNYAVYSNEYSGELAIPEIVTYNSLTYSVTSIGEEAFRACSSLNSVTISKNVTSIGKSAFNSCSYLISFTIPSNIVHIGESAFENCTNLTSIVIPNSITSIENYTFKSCSSLKDITIPSTVTTIGVQALAFTLWEVQQPDGIVYINDVLYEYKGDMKRNTSLEVKPGTISISPHAFFGGSNLVAITIPNSVKSIGKWAFKDCSDLTSIVIPEGITHIEEEILSLCFSLESVSIPEGVKSIGNNAFYACHALKTITIPNTIEHVGNNAFHYCDNLTDVHVKAVNVPNLGTIVFSSQPTCHIPCGTLAAYQSSQWANIVSNFVEECEAVVPDSTHCIFYTSTDGNIVEPSKTDGFGANIVSNTYENGQGVIIFDGPVTSIGNNAFNSCSTLNSIIISNSVTYIGQGAFSKCASLLSVVIPNSVTDIGYDAFGGCTSIVSVTIPESVIHIDDFAFENCNSLTSIIIPNNVSSIGRNPFRNCTSLASIAVKSDNDIYDSRDNCNAIIETTTNTLIAGCRNTIIPNSVTAIGGHVFEGCINLNSLTIPNSVSEIGTYAFSSCKSLTSVSIPQNVATIKTWAFAGCSSLSSIIIPNSVTSIESFAFISCSSLVSLTLGNSVASIEGSAFSKCNSLASVYIATTTPPILGINTFLNSTPTCYIPCGTLEAYEASDWSEQVGEFVEECEAEQYTRDVTPNRYGTICLPFGSTDFSGATFYEIAYKAPFMIYFDEVTKLEAGKPYIFYAHSNKLIVTSDGSRVNNPLFDNGLYGTFDEIVAAAINILTNNYIVNNNTLCLCGEYCSLSANRAYVKLDEVSSTARALSPGRKRVSMSVQGENTTTAFDNISEETENITIKEGVYDILGRKMSQPVGMGFYIIDGQKVIISQ